MEFRTKKTRVVHSSFRPRELDVFIHPDAALLISPPSTILHILFNNTGCTSSSKSTTTKINCVPFVERMGYCRATSGLINKLIEVGCNRQVILGGGSHEHGYCSRLCRQYIVLENTVDSFAVSPIAGKYEILSVAARTKIYRYRKWPILKRGVHI